VAPGLWNTATMIRAAFLVALSGAVLIACTSTVALPIDPSGRTACPAGVGLDAVLHGSPADPRVTWAVDRSSGRRIELIWPPGYRAGFDPTVAVFDDHGRVVARDGDSVDGGCRNVDQQGGPTWVSGSEIAHPYPLATVDPAVTTICPPGGAGSLVLHGAIEDGAARTWANDDATVYWPPGYTAEFSPNLVVRDPTHAERAREGDVMITNPWHGLNVCPQANGIVDVTAPQPSSP
jgi:hypothetical protein